MIIPNNRIADSQFVKARPKCPVAWQDHMNVLPVHGQALGGLQQTDFSAPLQSTTMRNQHYYHVYPIPSSLCGRQLAVSGSRADEKLLESGYPLSSAGSRPPSSVISIPPASTPRPKSPAPCPVGSFPCTPE